MKTVARFSVLQDVLLAALKQLKPGMPTRKADQRDDMLTHVFITAHDEITNSYGGKSITISFPMSDVKPVTIGAKVDIAGVTVVHFKTLFDVTKLAPKGRMDFAATEYASGENNGYGYTFVEGGTEVALTADLTRTRFRTTLASSAAPIYPVEELAEDLPAPIIASETVEQPVEPKVVAVHPSQLAKINDLKATGRNVDVYVNAFGQLRILVEWHGVSRYFMLLSNNNGPAELYGLGPYAIPSEDTPVCIAEPAPPSPQPVRQPRPLSRRERRALQSQLIAYLQERNAAWIKQPPTASPLTWRRSALSSTAPPKSAMPTASP